MGATAVYPTEVLQMGIKRVAYGRNPRKRRCGFQPSRYAKATVSVADNNMDSLIYHFNLFHKFKWLRIAIFFAGNGLADVIGMLNNTFDRFDA